MGVGSSDGETGGDCDEVTAVGKGDTWRQDCALPLFTLIRAQFGRFSPQPQTPSLDIDFTETSSLSFHLIETFSLNSNSSKALRTKNHFVAGSDH